MGVHSGAQRCVASSPAAQAVTSRSDPPGEAEDVSERTVFTRAPAGPKVRARGARAGQAGQSVSLVARCRSVSSWLTINR